MNQWLCNYCVHFDMIIPTEHIPGIADQLSFNHMQQFISSNPQAYLLPTLLSSELLYQTGFTQLFNITILKVYLLIHKTLSHRPNAMKCTNHHYLYPMGDSRIFLEGFLIKYLFQAAIISSCHRQLPARGVWRPQEN